MRRLFLLLTTASLLLAVATPAAAATDVYRYSVHGAGAWSSGAVYDGNRFKAFWVEIGDQLTDATDGQTYFSYVFFERLIETCDDTGCVTVYIGGMAENVPFHIDRKKFTTASVDVMVDSIRCTDDGQTQICKPVTMPVRISWTGYGPFIRSHGTATGGIAGVFQYTLNGAATERWANVTGTIGRFDIGTANPVGALYRTSYAERDIFHS